MAYHCETVSNFRLDLAQARFATSLMIVVFPIALVIYGVSGFDLRRRSEKRACRKGSASSCLAVGQFYEARTDGLVATLLSNATTAKDYFDRACKLGDRTGCARFGHMVVVGSYNGVRDDPFTRDGGMSALQKACDGGDTGACRELGEASDSAGAAPVFAKLCDAGDMGSCDKLVHAYLDTDPKRAIGLLTKLCDAGDNGHCRELGRAFLAGSDYVDADPPRGTALLTKACDRGAWGGCRDLGEAFLDGRLPPDPARASELLAKACSHSDVDACFDLGRAQIGSAPAEALKTFAGECEGGDVRGCDALGDLYRVGATGIPRDRARARSFYKAACRGDDFDCYKLRCVDADADACYKVHVRQRDRRFRLGGAFDMR